MSTCRVKRINRNNQSLFLPLPSFFAIERQKLHDDVYRIDASIKNLNEEYLIDVSPNNLVIFILPDVLKDLSLTTANFDQLLPLCFSLIYLLKLYLQCKLLSS